MILQRHDPKQFPRIIDHRANALTFRQASDESLRMSQPFSHIAIPHQAKCEIKF